MPTCTIPQPRMMMPRALMMEKMRSDRLLTMVSGSLPPAAKAGTVSAAQTARTRTVEK